MSKEITTRISPESIEIANAYLEKGDITAVSEALKVPRTLCQVSHSLLHAGPPMLSHVAPFHRAMRHGKKRVNLT